MNNRFLLYVAFSLVLFMVWQQWKIEQNPLPSTSKISEAQNNAEAFVDMPDEAIRDKKSETIKNVNTKLIANKTKKYGEGICFEKNENIKKIGTKTQKKFFFDKIPREIEKTAIMQKITAW